MKKMADNTKSGYIYYDHCFALDVLPFIIFIVHIFFIISSMDFCVCHFYVPTTTTNVFARNACFSFLSYFMVCFFIVLHRLQYDLIFIFVACSCLIFIAKTNYYL